MTESFNHIEKVKGELNLSGDKSISHRAVIFSSMAKGKSVIKNISTGEDVLSTINCFKNLGIEIENSNKELIINGKGYKGFTNPTQNLNAGNSGTTARLLTGLLCAQNFDSTIIGDESLSKRPMDRIIIPLQKMGAKIKSQNNFLPLNIYHSPQLNNISYELPVASAQVKSSIILAGLHCEDITSVVEKIPSRNHTETMLGLDVKRGESGNTILVSKKNYPVASEYFIPSDISSAAFFIVLALINKDSSLRIKNVSLNETRKGFLNLLEEMGAKINYENISVSSGEVYGDVIVESSALKNINIPGKIIPNIIDEIPALSVAGLFAEGDFIIRNASELRKKESDRINSLCYNYKKLGLDVEEFDDGFKISGEIRNKEVVFESFNDHRVAMAFGILALLLKEGGKVNNFRCVNISNPDFLNQLKQITG